MYGCGPLRITLSLGERGKSTGCIFWKTVFLIPIWQGIRTPPGSETRACSQRGRNSGDPNVSLNIKRKYGLELHPDKTKMIPFGKPNRTHDGKGLETFDFLGFTFYWAKSLKGYWIIKKKTIGKRLRRSKTRIWEWCRKNRHKPLKEQYERIYVKLMGHYQYYGVRSNYEALNSIYHYVFKSWRYWLNRRGSKRKVLYSFLTETFKLPIPRIVHNI